MKIGKGVLWLFTAAVLAAALLFAAGDAASTDQGQEVFLLELTSEQTTERIRTWRDGAGSLYVFLPSYARLDQTRIRLTNGRTQVWIDGEPVFDGMDCGGFALDRVYELTWTGGSGTETTGLTFLRSGNLPTLYIDVRSGSMEYIHSSVDNEESGAYRLYDAEGELDQAGDLKGFGGRGNATWKADKRPYNMKLSNAADLLGMGSAEKWVLFSNPYDPSHLRNKLVYDFARALDMPYTPQCQWVDLYLNGEYAGLYLLSERNEVHPQRVDLSEEGSFLVSRNQEWRMENRGHAYIRTDSGAALRIHDTTMPTERMRELWQSAENAIAAGDGVDPATGKDYRELIDLDSWARKYLIEEVFANVDQLSLFFYYDGADESGKIYAGPVWDYDFSLGNAMAWAAYSPNMFTMHDLVWEDGDWFSALYAKDDFYERMTQIYESEFLPLLTELTGGKLERYIGQIRQSAKLNQIRWSTKDPEGEFESLALFLPERIRFLSRAWIDGEDFCVVQACGADGTVMCYGVSPGGILPELPDYGGGAYGDLVSYASDPRENPLYEAETVEYLGWYVLDTGEPFDYTQPVWSEAVVYLKYAVDGVEAPPPAAAQSAVPEPEAPEPAVQQTDALRTEEPGQTALWESLLEALRGMGKTGLLRLGILAAFILIFLGLLLADRYRTKKNGRRKDDRTEIADISS